MSRFAVSDAWRAAQFANVEEEQRRPCAEMLMAFSEDDERRTTAKEVGKLISPLRSPSEGLRLSRISDSWTGRGGTRLHPRSRTSVADSALTGSKSAATNRT